MDSRPGLEAAVRLKAVELLNAVIAMAEFTGQYLAQGQRRVDRIIPEATHQ